MGKDHNDQPSRSNKQEQSGVKPVMSTENLQTNEERENYTNDEDRLAENSSESDRNKNTTKDDSTNAGGYRQ